MLAHLKVFRNIHRFSLVITIKSCPCTFRPACKLVPLIISVLVAVYDHLPEVLNGCVLCSQEQWQVIGKHEEYLLLSPVNVMTYVFITRGVSCCTSSCLSSGMLVHLPSNSSLSFWVSFEKSSRFGITAMKTSCIDVREGNILSGL